MHKFVYVLFLILGLSSPFVLKELRLDANLLNMLPDQKMDPAVELIREKMGQSDTRGWVLLISAADIGSLNHSLQALRNALFNSSLAEEVPFTTKQVNQIRDTYNEYRYSLLNAEDKQAITSGDTQQFVARTWLALTSPTSAISSVSLQQDPFQLFQHYMQARYTGKELHDGHMLVNTENGPALLVTAKVTFDLFESSKRNEFITLFNDFKLRLSDTTDLAWSGAVFYGHQAELGAKQEVTLFGGLSFVLIVVLMIYFFRSVKAISLVATTIFLACLAGLVSTSLVYGHINLVALAFATSLIGICIDYCAHFLVEAQYCSTDASVNASQRIKVALRLSVLSTVLAYSLMFLSPFPGLSQVAVFVAVGLLFSYLMVCYVFPRFQFPPLSNTLNPFHRVYSNPLKPCGAGTLLLVFGLFATLPAWLSVLNKEENLRAMYYRSPDLAQMQQKITQHIDFPDINQVLYVKGQDLERVLTDLELLEEHLANIRQQHPDFSWLSLGQWLPSTASQVANFQLHQKLYEEQLPQLADMLGIAPARLSTLIPGQIQQEQLLSYDVLESVMPTNIRRLTFKSHETWYSVVVLFNVPAEESLKSALVESQNIHYVDYLGILETTLQKVKDFLLQVLLGVFVAVALLLFWKYKTIHALSILLNSLVAINVLLACLFFTSQSLSIFHVFAMFLILGMNLDFILIFASGRGTRSHAALSCSIGAVTTLFAFGMLGMSQTPAIAQFGQSVAIGISVGWLASLMLGAKIKRFEETHVE